MRRPAPEELTDALFDLIVIGGGITGAATARDAALRGLSVLLVEKDDFAAGTSSRSSKLIHGGLRYLETYQFKLVGESVREREKMLTLAPHQTEIKPFLYLLYKGYPESKALLNLGLTFYDVVSGSWRRRRHSMLNADKVLQREPALNPEGLLGAGMYYDILTDDARLTLDTVKGATEAGAQAINHAAVTGLVLEKGVCRGVTITDTLGGPTFDVHARQVASATGPWTNQTREMEDGQPSNRLRPTKGVHIVVKKSDFPLNTAVFLRSPTDNRVVWPTPSLQDDVVYIGTTDTDYTGDLNNVHPDEEDIDYLLAVANHAIPEARLTQDHVVGSWAGLRPLIAPEPGVSASNTSREHAVTTGPTGMIAISGGKLTSNRVRGMHLVDAAIKAMGKPKGKKSAAATTPISGGTSVMGVEAAAETAAAPPNLTKIWKGRYGSNAYSVIDLWRQDPANREILGVRGITRAEIIYSVNEEMTRTLTDFMTRRTSIFFWDSQGGLDQIEPVAKEMGNLLSWSPEQRETEIEDYRRLVVAHRPTARD